PRGWASRSRSTSPGAAGSPARSARVSAPVWQSTAGSLPRARRACRRTVVIIGWPSISGGGWGRAAGTGTGAGSGSGTGSGDGVRGRGRGRSRGRGQGRRRGPAGEHVGALLGGLLGAVQVVLGDPALTQGALVGPVGVVQDDDGV